MDGGVGVERLVGVEGGGVSCLADCFFSNDCFALRRRCCLLMMFCPSSMHGTL